MGDSDAEEECQVSHLSALFTEEFDRRMRVLDEPAREAGPSNDAGAQNDEEVVLLEAGDSDAAGLHAPVQASEEIFQHITTLESRPADLPALLKQAVETEGVELLEGLLADLQASVDNTPDGHLDKPSRLIDLGNVLLARFERLGEIGDLKRALDANRHAIRLTSDDHPDKAIGLDNLGNGLLRRFERLGELEDLGYAIDAYRSAVNLTPDGHPRKPITLNSLGYSFRLRFERVGEIEDLERAIDASRHAVDLTSDGHPDQPARLSNLALGFQNRFKYLGDIGDLEHAIDAMQRAVDVTADSHPDKAANLCNLGNSFRVRFDHLGEVEDLEGGIDANRRAIRLVPDGHPSKPTYLKSLRDGLLTRFERRGDVRNLEHAFDISRNAVDLTPDGHPDKPGYLNNLGSDFFHRFERLGQIEDLEYGIDANRRAVDLTPDGHPDLSSRASTLGDGIFQRFQRFSEPADFQDALQAYLRAADQRYGPPSIRLDAAEKSANMCWLGLQRGLTTHDQLVSIYERAMSLISSSQVARLANIVRQHSEERTRIGQLVNGAVAATIAAGRLTKAVEWFEQGRDVVWGQLVQPRNGPLDDLRAVQPDLANKFDAISRALEKSAGLSIGSEGVQETASKPSPQSETSMRIRMAFEYQFIVDHIRKIEGFEHFLMPHTFSSLSRSSENRPVVLINIHDTRCDTLILCPAGRVFHVPLPELTLEIAGAMQAEFVGYLANQFERSMARHNGGGSGEAVLERLWSRVVKPILHAIDEERAWLQGSSEDLPHITWCPTGPLSSLPLHAAGDYRSRELGTKTFERVVSSYTPSLSAMLRPPLTRPLNLSRSENILIISQAQILPAVGREVGLIKDAFAECAIVHLDRGAATVEASLAAMGALSPRILHIACRGIQNTEYPMKSALILADDAPLELSRLKDVTTDDAALAVLSVRQTAMGDAKPPEEAVHLAAGMLSVGYRAVVGTMWSIADEDAPDVAKEFYTQVKLDVDKRKERGDGRSRVAYALHMAVAKLRERVGVANTSRWAPYVHFGQ